MINIFSFLAVLGLLGAATALDLNRPCPTNVDAISGFRVPDYLGSWYEIERYDDTFQANGDCGTATYDLNPDGSVRVENSMVMIATGKGFTVVGRADLSFPMSDPLMAKLNVSFFGQPNDRSNYWVLDTDYKNFAVVWQCQNTGENLSRENYWLLSRTKILTTEPEVLAKIAAVTDNLIFREEVRTTVHTPESCLGSVTPFAARNSAARLG